MKAKQYIQTQLDSGKTSREIARKLLDMKIGQIMGLSIDDLPDVLEFAEAIDNIEAAIDDDINIDDIKFELNQFDFEYVEQICW